MKLFSQSGTSLSADVLAGCVGGLAVLFNRSYQLLDNISRTVELWRTIGVKNQSFQFNIINAI